MAARGGRGGPIRGRPRDTRSAASGAEVRIPVPQRVHAAWDAVRPDSGTHPVYWLARMVRWRPKDGRPWGEADKTGALDASRAAMEAQARRDLARRVLERRGAWLAMRERAGTARRLRLTARTDAVLWLASPGPLEVGLALHHLYGFPVLPGSGLKGLAGRVAREVREPAVAEARYGGPDGAGPVAFLDGLPTGEWKVQRDVMTPHFMRWYSEESGVLPDDTESPIPIGFLAIGAGSCFEVALVARRLGDAAHLDGIVEDLRIGLEELGLGAKTAAGYGVFALEVAAGVARGAPGPPPTPARSAAADAVAAQIAALRRHEVRGRLAALVAEIERCSEHEREALAGILRQQLVALGLAGPELRDLQARYPILRGPSE